jgi:hypothetical protein
MQDHPVKLVPMTARAFVDMQAQIDALKALLEAR